MKRLAALLIGIASISAATEPDARTVTFSTFSPDFQLVAYDEQTHTHRFRGTSKLSGTLFLDFDMDERDRANSEILFQKFVPDPESVSKLPAVIQGFYPSPVRYVSLDAPLEQLSSLFGGSKEFKRVSHGASHEVSRRATVVLRDYFATVEC